MYHWIEDKEFLGKMRRECSDIVNQLVQNINKGNYLKVKMGMVGSGAKNLITQNDNEPIDLDYNICILEINGNINDCKEIKEYIRIELNKVLQSKKLEDCKDSTSALTTSKLIFTTGNNKTQFSIDVAIVYKSKEKFSRLLHEKTGNVSKDEWIWNKAPDSNKLNKRITFIKEKLYRNELRETYLEKKNFYLQTNDHNHPSFNCYIEAINEVYQKHI